MEKSPFHSPIQDFLFPACFVDLLAALAFAAWFYQGGGFPALLLLGISTFYFLAGFWLLLNFSCELCLSVDDRSIQMIYQVGPWQKRAEVCRFADISAFYVQGRQNRDKIRTWWTYALFARKHDQAKIRLSDWHDRDPIKVNRLGQRFSDFAQLPFFAAQEEKVTVIDKSNGQISALYHDWSAKDTAREFSSGIILAIMMIGAIFGFIVAMVLIFSQ
ncbi:MAG: hypothetical protein ACOYXC_12565 [Candidatus Rifleibacteriota bacterium]